MLTVNIGPLALAIPHVILLGSLLLASLVGWRVGRRSGRNPERQLFRLLLLAVLVARLAFVASYWSYYRDDWLDIIDIRDGGFIPWPGLLAGLALGVWWGWRDRGLRKPLGIALTVGLLGWGFGNLAWYSFEQGTRLPEMALRDSQGRPVALEDYAGQPLVINLWATWCPPCRREMPVLADAQARERDTLFLFVNQGEGEGEINRFMERAGLKLDNVLLDSGGRLGQHVGSTALPTTLFYDAKGRQVASHLGELSHASLARALEKLKEDVQ